ncbi:DinB family protein [Streptacidiphilus sp. ASG 303]|uniref:DinB family protein n=1 Tax=Streptacidiphilus sp. ASG 303 TaxID=2896847 RepID=UPI001E43DE1C|nr:DinB family protein [Streptacidiphilus sp. ASG 303]MCD0485452.1 DinB family protein [Streptacidiphilus sp. ASG 303]
MTEARTDPSFVSDERTMLDSWLDYHRATLALKCEGLDADQLRRRSAEPSNLSLLGLVRHMAEVERHWFQGILGGEEFTRGRYWSEERPDGDFDDVDTADPAEAFATWRAECEGARKAAAGLPLDTVGRRQRRGEDVSLRWILVHMIEEYARHNGHADLLRERIDGATGE